MKLTFPHIASYVTAGLAWLAALNPLIVSSVVGPKLGALAAPLIALAGAALVLIHDVAPTKATVTTVAKLLVLALFVPAIVLTSGCAYMSTLVAPASLPLEQAAVAAAVSTVIGNDKAKAARVVSIARAVLAIDQNTNMALVDVEIIVNAKIAALKLPPLDAALAASLTAALGQAVQQQLALTTKGAISPQTQVAIADVCNWVIVDAGG